MQVLAPELEADDLSIIQSIKTNDDNMPLPLPAVSISSKRKHLAIDDLKEDGDRKSLKSVHSTTGAASLSSASLPLKLSSLSTPASTSSGTSFSKSFSAKTKVKSVKAKSMLDNEALQAINELAQAFKLSLLPNVLDPTAHTQTEAGNGVISDDNGLTIEEKAEILGIFAWESSLAHMYLVVQQDRPIMLSFLHKTLDRSSTS